MTCWWKVSSARITSNIWAKLLPPAEVQDEAQPREVHIRGCFWEIFRVSGHSTGNQSRHRPDICHLKYEVTHMCERDLDVERTSHCPEPIHQPIHGQMHALLPNLEEERGWFLLEWRMGDSFSRSKEIFGFTTALVQAHLERNIVPIPGRLRVSREQSPNSWKQRRTEAGVLH